MENSHGDIPEDRPPYEAPLYANPSYAFPQAEPPIAPMCPGFVVNPPGAIKSGDRFAQSMVVRVPFIDIPPGFYKSATKWPDTVSGEVRLVSKATGLDYTQHLVHGPLQLWEWDDNASRQLSDIYNAPPAVFFFINNAIISRSDNYYIRFDLSLKKPGHPPVQGKSYHSLPVLVSPTHVGAYLCEFARRGSTSLLILFQPLRSGISSMLLERMVVPISEL